MKISGYAYFVDHPRRIDELTVPHGILAEQEFEVAKIISLCAIDYENFITDMVADHQFIEDNAQLCSEGAVRKCLLVKQRGRKGGVLVMPEDGCYVKCAAYYFDVG